jgi:Protein of unknown function (DUF664)
MTDDNGSHSMIDDTSETASELEVLMFALDRARDQFAWKVGGLDAAGLNALHPPSAMTLGGLIKHQAHVEDNIVSHHLTGAPVGSPWNAVDYQADPDWDWRSAAADSPAELYELWRGAVERSKSAWARVLADGGLDQPSRAGDINLRRVLVDTIEQNIRHTGNADLVREAIDGLVGEDPPLDYHWWM